ncbi:MAG: flippase-like domain-containing protein [Ignavibacteria bacterium]|nr:flippase-like domain-containing protein [Ignavibacteria bacterium]MBT8383247.1 flippase-like domain-containing protein [Ignavibacteria bacterium]NNL21597.1 flippase-like domain-containing protein [Ignavibacteriaceae bacterium]
MTSDNTKKIPALRGIFNFVISIGLAALFLYLAFYDVDFSEVLQIVSHASIFWMIGFILLSMSGHVVRTVRWKVILHSVKPDAKIKHLFGALMVGYGVNCITPKLGEVTRAMLIGKWENLSRSSMFGTVIVERVIDILSLGAAVLVSAFIWSSSLYESFPWLKSTLYVSAILMIIVLTLIYLSVKFKEKFYGAILKIIGKLSVKLSDRLGYIFEMLIQGFTSLKGARNYLLTALLSILLLIVYALAAFVGFYMLDMQNVTLTMGWVLMSISAIGTVIPTPGATGSYHALAKSTLVLLFGFGETISAAYAFLTHIISYILFILIALIMFLILNKQHINLFKYLKTNNDKK